MSTYEDAEVENIFQGLLAKAAKGTRTHSMAAPALATEFVKSKFKRRAQPNSEGALAEIVLPSQKDIDEKVRRKHPTSDLFAYKSTAAADAYPAGYGERSAMALAKEDQTFQLKGAFVSASIAMSKLRARTEARNGSPDAVNRIFAKLWGLSEEQADMVPHLHISGSESTRMAAMEDRAYHALSGHPGHTGGFRVDMASLAPDALGSDVPLNWPRIRTGLKAIANMQVNADLEMIAVLESSRHEVAITMDMTRASQPRYQRCVEWEGALDAMLMGSTSDSIRDQLLSGERTIPGALMRSLLEGKREGMFDESGEKIRNGVQGIAKLVKAAATATLSNIVQVITEHSGERRLLLEAGESEYEELDISQMSKSFDVPRYKLTRTSVKRGLTQEDRNPDRLPDMNSRGPKVAKLDTNELRSAGMIVPVDIPSILNLAVYLTVNRLSLAVPAYKLVTLVKDPQPGGIGKVASRLRAQSLYDSEAVRELGPQLFAEDFLSIFETLCSNMAHSARDNSDGIKRQLWDYLCRRTNGYHQCPVLGDWRDLITYLLKSAEGWTLFYWARVSMGKLHYAVGNDILAPIAAGESVDFLTLMRRSVQARAKHWAAYYSAQAQLLSQDLDEHRTKLRKMRKELNRDPVEEIPDIDPQVKRYIPPHLRKYAQLEHLYDDDEILGRRRGYTKEQYRRMVELQSKAKFFRNMVVASKDRKISVGISDSAMRDVVIEFYQARWYSLHKRLERAQMSNIPFYLGRWHITEHPWGELKTTYPSSLQGVLDMCSTLDARAWTVPLQELWVKFNKSLSELWQDVSTEIQRIQDYISEVHDCLADVQVERDAQRRVESVLKSMSDVAAIPIPAPGYRLPYRLPERVVEVASLADGAPMEVEYRPMDHVATTQDDELEDVGEFGGLDDEPDDPGGGHAELLDVGSMHSTSQEVHVQISRYLSYNEIWAELVLPEVDDTVKRAAFGLPSSMRLDSQHLDAKYGPVVVYEEAHRTSRLWGRLKGGMLKRLGQGVFVAPSDDM